MKTKIIAFMIRNYYKIAFGAVGASLFLIGNVMDRESQYLAAMGNVVDNNTKHIAEIQNNTED